MEISETIRELEKEKEILKIGLKARGSFETDQFRSVVSEYSQTHVTSVSGLIEKFGKRALGGLLKESLCVRVVVSAKLQATADRRNG